MSADQWDERSWYHIIVALSGLDLGTRGTRALLHLLRFTSAEDDWCGWTQRRTLATALDLSTGDAVRRLLQRMAPYVSTLSTSGSHGRINYIIHVHAIFRDTSASLFSHSVASERDATNRPIASEPDATIASERDATIASGDDGWSHPSRMRHTTSRQREEQREPPPPRRRRRSDPSLPLPEPTKQKQTEEPKPNRWTQKCGHCGQPVTKDAGLWVPHFHGPDKGAPMHRKCYEAYQRGETSTPAQSTPARRLQRNVPWDDLGHGTVSGN